jgi:hypothetical protein
LVNESPENEVRIDDIRPSDPQWGDKIFLGHGIYYYRYVPCARENSTFVQVEANWKRLKGAWSIKFWLRKRELKKDWDRLLSEQERLLSSARENDDRWSRLRIEERGDSFKTALAEFDQANRDYELGVVALNGRCAGLLSPSDHGSCVSDANYYAHIQRALVARVNELNSRWDSIADDIGNLARDITEYNGQVLEWEEDLKRFNARMKGEIISKGKWSCVASCNVQQIEQSVECPARVKGSATDSTEELACRSAKRVATQSTPQGCYPRHCRCDCKD